MRLILLLNQAKYGGVKVSTGINSHDKRVERAKAL